MEDRDILAVFERAEDPVLFTGEVAEEIDFSNQGTLPRLKNLKEQGYLDSKRGGKVLVWWLTDEGRAISEGRNDR